MTTTIQFTKHDNVLFNDSFTDAHVTEEGAVNYYRNGVGGVTGFDPILGESRFSSFLATGTSGAAALYSVPSVKHGHVEWPYFYMARDSVRQIHRVDLTTGTVTQATAAIGSGSTIISDIDMLATEGYGLFVRGNSQVREWTKASEPSASTAAVFTGSPGDLERLAIDADENVWLSGNDGYVVVYDAIGSLLFSIQLPGCPIADPAGYYVAGLACPSNIIGAVAFLEQEDGLYDWFHIDPSGSYTNITADVTVDGVSWDTHALSPMPGPSAHLSSWGNRVGFANLSGFDYYLGLVNGRSWGPGPIGWPRNPST